MKKYILTILFLAGLLYFTISSMMRYYVVGQNYDVNHYSTAAPKNYSEDSFVKNLQAQNLWVDLETEHQESFVTPPISYKYIPKILSEIKHVPTLKNSFVSVVLPLILIANAEIKTERQFIERIRSQQGELSSKDKKAWDKLLQRYKCQKQTYTCLQLRVQAIPVPLALGQAALESGWGTSRFAKEGNALFGQWTNEKSSQYIKALDSDEVVKLRAFDNLLDGVRSYILNLNTHRAYRDFRKQRLQYISGNITFDDLLSPLENYAEKENYTKLLLTIIRENHFRRFHHAALGAGGNL